MDEWCVRESGVDLDSLPRWAALLTLANGHLGVRGDLDEGVPWSPTTYLRPVYEERPLSYAERGYSYPAYEQRMVPVVSGAVVRLDVDGDPLDVCTGTLQAHERTLDLRAGVLDRTLSWVSPQGAEVRVASRRLVPLTRRGLLAVAYEVTAVSRPVRVTLRSELVPAEQAKARAGAEQPDLERMSAERWQTWPTGAYVVEQTTTSGVLVATAAEHAFEGAEADVESSVEDGVPVLTARAELEPGARLRLVKLVSYATAQVESPGAAPSATESVATAALDELRAAQECGWERLEREQREYLEAFWDRADLVVEGDDELRLAVRYALYQVLQAAAQVDGHGIPAKGLTGAGYEGHTFWDQESFVLPVLSRVLPESAAAVLTWRHANLPHAVERARHLRISGGAAYPWRTITGHESSGYWPASTAALHNNADIADAVLRHVAATGDQDFAEAVGIDLVVQTARLWCAIGHFDDVGGFHIDGVTGPDEYSAVADDNVYTNLMAQRNLLAAADWSERFPERAAVLGVDDEERGRWRRAAAGMAVPRNDALGVTEQAAGFTRHAQWDFAATSEDDYPLVDHFPYFELYRKQVVKQADLVLALWRRADAFSREQMRRDFDYYEAITVRDSSLSAPVQAVVAARGGHLGLAHEYAREAALVDLHDLRGSTADGLHLGSLAGSWLALVAGFAGMSDDGDGLAFSPRLPPALRRLRFGLLHRGAHLRVDVTRETTTYAVAGGSVGFRHYDEEVELTPEKPEITLPVEAVAEPPRPPHPPHRAPGHADLSSGSGGRGNDRQ